MKTAFLRVLVPLEGLFDRLLNRTGKDRIVEAYAGYATDDQMIVRGRVLTALRRNEPLPQQGVWTNVRQMLSLFLTDEVAEVTVRAGRSRARTDEEGYFQIVLPRPEARGWIEVPVTIDGRQGSTPCPVLVPRADAEFMVISDIDDTMMETGAYSLARNLWTSFTGNALTRRVFPDAVALIRDLSANGRNPVYYVSSSPWNLYSFLTAIFERAGLVPGPMFLRDLGLSETKLITDGHGSHKGGSIDLLLAGSAPLQAILIGDTGQKDARIYREAFERHPGRIRGIVLRVPGPGLDAADRQDLAALERAGIELFHGSDFTGMAHRIRRAAPSSVG